MSQTENLNSILRFLENSDGVPRHPEDICNGANVEASTKEAFYFLNKLLSDGYVSKHNSGNYFSSNQKGAAFLKDGGYTAKLVDPTSFTINDKNSDAFSCIIYRIKGEKVDSKYQVEIPKALTINPDGTTSVIQPNSDQLLLHFNSALHKTHINEIDEFLCYHYMRYTGKSKNWIRFMDSRIKDMRRDLNNPSNEYIDNWFLMRKKENGLIPYKWYEDKTTQWAIALTIAALSLTVGIIKLMQ